MQNNVGDLQSLLRFIRVQPWDQEALWKSCVKPQVRMGNAEVFSSINRVMESISIRRTKDAVLVALKKKVSHWIPVAFDTKWLEPYQSLFVSFLLCSRVDGAVSQERCEEGGSFFKMLLDLRQFCNHPAFVYPKEEGLTWADSPKIVHLLKHVRQFFEEKRGGTIPRPKVVIFSNYVQFLEM